YPGHGDEIIGWTVNFLGKWNVSINWFEISIVNVGKKSAAHKISCGELKARKEIFLTYKNVKQVLKELELE
ncbi:hypothetical protein KKH30_04945, partial [Candidatus Micrarchaeota archaeon]|nr:hypothetical protein [Candidatus Micrarchaeota archaeon]